MIQQTPQADKFKQQMRESLQQETGEFRCHQDRPARECLHLWRSR